MPRMTPSVGRRNRSTQPALIVIKIVYLDEKGEEIKTVWAVVTKTSPPVFKSKEFDSPQEAYACLDNWKNRPTPP